MLTGNGIRGSLVQTNRIPTQGLKLLYLRLDGLRPVGPNKQNPDSGIETGSFRPPNTHAPGPNKQNPDSGIETYQYLMGTGAGLWSKQTESRLRD